MLLILRSWFLLFQNHYKRNGTERLMRLYGQDKNSLHGLCANFLLFGILVLSGKLIKIYNPFFSLGTERKTCFRRTFSFVPWPLLKRLLYRRQSSEHVTTRGGQKCTGALQKCRQVYSAHRFRSREATSFIRHLCACRTPLKSTN